MRLSVVGWYCSICWIILFQDSSSTYYVDGAGVVPLFSWAVPYSVERRCSEGFCNRCSRNIQQVMTHRRQGLYVVQRSDETFHLHHDNGDLSPMFTKSSNEMANMQNIGRDAGEGGCIIGDTKGATLLLENVSISRGSNQILQSVSLRVERNERWGIVGTNGCGKVSVKNLKNK